jgi:collagenase-like PrtC family protease
MDLSGTIPTASGATPVRPKLTLGPVLFNWPPELLRDFYYRIADEAPLDVVYVGEVVCLKRLPFFAPYLPAVIERLEVAGKEVVLSSAALVASPRESAAIRELASDDERLVEANDIAAVSLLAGKRHIAGPYINVYNAQALRVLTRLGAVRTVLPWELPRAALCALAATGLPVEVQVFGRAPLAISARCYHARLEDLHKDGCRFVCEKDLDGLPVETIEGMPILAVNGVQTLSHACISLAGHLDDLLAMGIRHFRLSPHTIDMVAIAEVFLEAAAGTISQEDVHARVQELADGMPLADGFYRGLPGATLISTAAGSAP